MDKTINVLDKGFVRVVNKMGDDSSPVQAARISYGRGTKTPEEDKNLTNYLMRNQHNTPFEMCQIVFHIKAPIFVARQWFRHRSSSYNEISARYTEVKDEFYVPELDHIKPQSTSNHQGRGDNAMPGWLSKRIKLSIEESVADSYDCYQGFIGVGLAKELARSVLPVAQYTEFYWSINLRNLFHFLQLRCDSHAQYEIRVYAEAICEFVKEWVPNCYEAFEKYILNAKTISGPAINTLKTMATTGKSPSQAESGMSKREYNELMEMLNVGV